MAEEVNATCNEESLFSNLRTFGRVKWFNNKAGYGFITVLHGPHKDTDIFIHHSGIIVNGSHYKYLLQGEYVSFDVTETSDDSKYEKVGSEVRGVLGNELMCEVLKRVEKKIEKKRD